MQRLRVSRDMAHGLGFMTIAEGVETQLQLDYLRAQGCDEIQGYLTAQRQWLSAYFSGIGCAADTGTAVTLFFGLPSMSLSEYTR